MPKSHKKSVGWMGGGESLFKDCLQQYNNKKEKAIKSMHKYRKMEKLSIADQIHKVFASLQFL